MAIQISPTGQISSSFFPSSTPAPSGMITPAQQISNVTSGSRYSDVTGHQTAPVTTPTSVPTPVPTPSSTGDLGLKPPQPTIPPLDYKPPSTAELQTQYDNFLKAAEKDPKIIDYYQGLLNLAQGDTTIATQFLNKDYETGTRQITDTLGNTLQQYGLAFKTESNNMLDQLNKRGIALTQDANGALKYAGGGQAATEYGQMRQSQQLRHEAASRTADQQKETLGITREKGLATTGQLLKEQQATIGKQEQIEAADEAQRKLQLSLQGEQSKLSEAETKQKQQQTGTGIGDTELQQLAKTSRNPVQETRYQQLLSGTA